MRESLINIKHGQCSLQRTHISKIDIRDLEQDFKQSFSQQ